MDLRERRIGQKNKSEREAFELFGNGFNKKFKVENFLYMKSSTWEKKIPHRKRYAGDLKDTQSRNREVYNFSDLAEH